MLKTNHLKVLNKKQTMLGSVEQGKQKDFVTKTRPLRVPCKMVDKGLSYLMGTTGQKANSHGHLAQSKGSKPA